MKRKRERIVIILCVMFALYLLYSIFFVKFCGQHKPLSNADLAERIAYAQEGNETALVSLSLHYAALSDRSDVYAFYRILVHRDYYPEYYKELEHILNDPLRLKRFIADCSLDNFCASSDVYKHYYSIYQSLPDENKTAPDQMAVDLARNEQEAKPCGLFASIKKLFTCG